MTRDSFVALAVSLLDGVVAHGVFGTRADARLCADWRGINDPDVTATRTVALFPPDAEPVLTHNTTRGEVFPLPDEVMAVLTNETPEATAHDECVIALVVVPTEPRAAFAVGPFDRDQAHQWLTDASTPREGRSVECCLLPVRASTLGTSSAPATTTDTPVPSIVLLDTSNGPVCYGPFDSALDGALFWHDITRTLDLTNVHGTHVCELITPAPDAALATASEETPGADRVRGWVVRLDPSGCDRDGDPRVVGLFADQSSARDWRPALSSSEATSPAAILPVYQP
ncbi:MULTISPECIES: hypothetical protein [Amycolatopsis]|uniref:Uncharacterized protein n=2 Tax=Amycolatopsis TaxID=1813 RepID=A0A2N3WEZ4_9PSEU|nr:MULTISPECIES: hypothetical protein [Amycolatopsis]MBB2505970.1 hypothetical protein [Amycolatopsis echigonensis]PKV92442.1 hypothetical protein ATK30_3246 [Amycolatopsis niigatensis]TVT16772.1 hypothetical protein FNH06_34040 [Amycolatopsis acidiphila]UIJ59628.1 hypothetical protein LWP59_37360 [Amycolatopsis acidiphila]GHG80980.1 hypothetical protein GCM10017788_50520 [Amycolatopsis acidiphila]